MDSVSSASAWEFYRRGRVGPMETGVAGGLAEELLQGWLPK